MKGICAITGSNGYVGGRIKTVLAARGWEIFELTRSPRANSRGMQFRLGDDVSPQLLSGVTALVHCAYDFAPLRWEEISAVNIEGSRKILEAARAAGVKKIVFISSISAFEGCRSLYGKAKLETEKIALANGALVIRPGLVYGKNAGGMFGRLAQSVRRSALVPLIGGNAIQYLVYDEDLAAFIERYAAGEAQIEPQILTAANERPWPFKQMILELAKAAGTKPKFVPVPWRFVWMGLKSAEMSGLRLAFRSDSLIGLVYQNGNPDFSSNARAGLVCRPFDGKEI